MLRLVLAWLSKPSTPPGLCRGQLRLRLSGAGGVNF